MNPEVGLHRSTNGSIYLVLISDYDSHGDDYQLHASLALLHAHTTSAKKPVGSKSVSCRNSHSIRALRESTQNASETSCRS